jgi:hypothetical protein
MLRRFCDCCGEFQHEAISRSWSFANSIQVSGKTVRIRVEFGTPDLERGDICIECVWKVLRELSPWPEPAAAERAEESKSE